MTGRSRLLGAFALVVGLVVELAEFFQEGVAARLRGDLGGDALLRQLERRLLRKRNGAAKRRTEEQECR